MLTFGPDGMTGHEGHKTVSRWATDEFREVAPSGARMFYATQTPELAAEWVPKLEPFDMFLPGTPPVTPREELGICYSLSGSELDRKVRGIQEHASQIEGLRKVFRGRWAPAFHGRGVLPAGGGQAEQQMRSSGASFGHHRRYPT